MKINWFYKFVCISLSGFLISSCQSNSSDTSELPILGNWHINTYEKDGQQVSDTVYHTIANFKFINQERDTITNEDVVGKVYVADFFFTSCPTICPAMKTQMLRVYEQFKDESNFLILSHTIDPEYDTADLLKDFANKIGIENAKTWHFLTGDQEMIYKIGQTSYLTTAMEDKNEPGGFLHSGAFVLVDQQGRIRGIYDGTKPDKVDQLISDLPSLLIKK